MVMELSKLDKVDVNQANIDGNTALIIGSYYGHNYIVVALLEQDMLDVNHQNNDGRSALTMASENGHAEIVFEFLKHDEVDTNLQDINGWTALTWASWKGYTDILDQLLHHGKWLVNLPTQMDDTSLLFASIAGHSNVVWKVLKYDPLDALKWTTDKRNPKIVMCVKELALNASRHENDENERFDTKEQGPSKKQHKHTLLHKLYGDDFRNGAVRIVFGSDESQDGYLLRREILFPERLTD